MRPLEEQKDKLEKMQDFFWKSFLISFALLVVACFLSSWMHDFQFDMAKSFFNINVVTFNKVVFLALSFWKVLVVQFTLIPALTVLWIRKQAGFLNKK